MTKQDDASFSKLVEAIDEKWKHTYLDPPPEETISWEQVTLKDFFESLYRRPGK